jgi:hypothetical protein
MLLAAYPRDTMKRALPVRLLAALGLVLLGTACKEITTMNFREVPVTPQVRARKQAPLPARVGLYISDDFMNFHFEIDQKGLGGIASYLGWIDPGRPLAIAFYQGACGTFEHAYFLEAFTPGQPVADRDTQLVIVPRIERFEFRAAHTGFSSNAVTVRLHTVVYDGGGRTLFTVDREVKRTAAMIGSMLGNGSFGDVKRICDEASSEVLDQTLGAIQEQRTASAAGGS